MTEIHYAKRERSVCDEICAIGQKWYLVTTLASPYAS